MAKIKYKGELLAEITDGQPITLHTTGHSLSGDITIEDLGGGSGVIEVDELPTEDIDTDAFYLCNGEYYKFQPGDGMTWVFNDELNFDGLEVDTTYYVDYKCVGVDTPYTGFKYSHQANEVYALSFVEYKYGGDYTTAVYYTDSLWGNPAGWGDEKYKTIVFSELPTDESLIGWIKNNATAPSGEWLECTFGTAVIECSSPDELPTDVKNGTMAIVSLCPASYLLNETVEFDGLDVNEEADAKANALLSDGYSNLWDSIMVGALLDRIILRSVGGISTGQQVYDRVSGWVTDEHVNFADYPRFLVYWATPKTKEWLDANAASVGTATDRSRVLYLYENGQWIAKTIYTP